MAASCDGDSAIDQVFSAARVAAQKARNVTPALAAWEYSHRLRSVCQSSRWIVQFCVARLTGSVQIAKITRLTTISTAAAVANPLPVVIAKATLAIAAAGRKKPTNTQPR